MRQLLDPSGPSQRTQSHPLKTSLYFFLFYALTLAISFHLPNTWFLTRVQRLYLPCGKFWKFHVVKVTKIIPMPRPFTSFTIQTKIQIMQYSSVRHTLPPRQFASNHLHPLHFCIILLTLTNALMVAWPWSCLPLVTQKSYKKKPLSSPPNVVTLTRLVYYI
jgi:hypothetical protein